MIRLHYLNSLKHIFLHESKLNRNVEINIHGNMSVGGYHASDSSTMFINSEVKDSSGK